MFDHLSLSERVAERELEQALMDQQQIRDQLVALDVEPDLPGPTNAIPCPNASSVCSSRAAQG